MARRVGSARAAKVRFNWSDASRDEGFLIFNQMVKLKGPSSQVFFTVCFFKLEPQRPRCGFPIRDRGGFAVTPRNSLSDRNPTANRRYGTMRQSRLQMPRKFSYRLVAERRFAGTLQS